MSSILKIKEEYLTKGITNTFLAEKAGISPAELFELDPQNKSSRKEVFNRIFETLNSNDGGFKSEKLVADRKKLTLV